MSTAIEKTKQQVATIRTTLIKSRGQIAQALPRHMDVDRLLRVIMTSVQRTPELLECSTISLLGAVIQTAQLGLEPDNVVGEAYLLPFKKRVQLIPGYKGLVKLARNSGQISSITAEVVYRQDKYTFAKGLAEKLEHIPSQDPDPRSDKDIVAFYCIVRLKDGGVQWEWMWRWEVDKIRNSSPGKGASGPWVTHYAEMGKKTVIRRTCKLLPYSIELSRAVALDELADAGLDQKLESVIDLEASEADGEDNQEGAQALKPAAASRLDELVEKEKAKTQEGEKPEAAPRAAKEKAKAEEPQQKTMDGVVTPFD